VRHEWEFFSSTENNETGRVTERYRCDVCGAARFVLAGDGPGDTEGCEGNDPRALIAE
jgi:hypothetical protein